MTEPIPRMRTAAGIVAEIKALDPGSGVTEYYIRQLAREGRLPAIHAGSKTLINLDDVLPAIHAGSKTLINLDDVLALLRTGTPPPDSTPKTPGGIRRLDARLK